MGKNIVAGALASVLLAGCGATIPTGYRPSESTTPATGMTTVDVAQRQSPVEISGTTLSGQEFSTTQLDGIVVVNAWASWCAPCREEWPTFVELESNYPQVNLLGLNEADELTAAIEFVNDAGGTWTHLRDPNQLLALESGTISGNFLPGTIVLDTQHRVAAQFIGKVTEPELTQIIEQLLAEN
ncbi:MAG: TlpA disulfide reductase family protein [Actinomycetes bacterium]